MTINCYHEKIETNENKNIKRGEKHPSKKKKIKKKKKKKKYKKR